MAVKSETISVVTETQVSTDEEKVSSSSASSSEYTSKSSEKEQDIIKHYLEIQHKQPKPQTKYNN
jgi:hypothetical protein